MSSDTTGVTTTPGSAADTAYSPYGTPSAGTSRTPAGSASITEVTVPLRRLTPAGSPARGGPTRTVAAGRRPGADGNGTASAAVVVPAARPVSSSPSSAEIAAAVATTELPR